MRITLLLATFGFLFNVSCKNKNESQTLAAASVELKRGEIISCGPQQAESFGTVAFDATVPRALQKDFNTAIALLHSFEYDEAEKMFARVIDKEPGCAMAWWGVAMSNFHPLWAPSTPAELKKGMQAVEIARSIQNKTPRESRYIEAVAKYYENADKLDQRSRVLNFEKAMEEIYKNYPDDKEAPVFYALALNAAAEITDKTYSRQKKAFRLLEPIFNKEPLHPGIAHYIIHNMDYPEVAELALPAARKYASIAPSSAHAQHMPSHIFTRLGLWDDCIKSNLAAMTSAQCYAEQAKIKGHWDEELHALDYLVYSYLQTNNDAKAKEYLDYVRTINEVSPVNFKVAYAFAAIPARYALERKDWKQAAELKFYPANFPWKDFPWQKAIIHFARTLGNVHLNNLPAAEKELDTLRPIYDILKDKKNMANEAAQVSVQIKTSEAWIEYLKGNKEKAIELMKAAANAEDAMEKHPVTPGSVVPARELLGEMLLEMGQPGPAVNEFDHNLKLHANRRNGLIGLNKAKAAAKK
jgi:hypothetical protein